MDNNNLDMKDDNSINKDIKCAIEICNSLIAENITQEISRPEIIKLPTIGEYNKSAINRAIRELIRLKVFVPKGNKGYMVENNKINKAIDSLLNINKKQISIYEVKQRLKEHQFLVRTEINSLFPELSIQNIDTIIIQLKNDGFLKNHKAKGRGSYFIDTNKNNLYITDITAKLAAISDDVILCYNSALEYHNLSRYASTNVIYISGKTSRDIDHIFPKKIKNIDLKQKDFGIIEADNDLIKVTDIERTIIDCIRLPKYALGWENIFHAIKNVKKIDEGKIMEYLICFSTPTLSSKVGLVLEHFKDELDIQQHFFSRLSLYRNNTPFRLIRNSPGSLNKTWNIYVPKNFFDYA